MPFYDVGSGKVYQVSVQYILDFVFYQDGERTPPTDIDLGDSIFDEPKQQPWRTETARSTSKGRSRLQSVDIMADQLSDSEDDSGDDRNDGLAEREPTHSGAYARTRSVPEDTHTSGEFRHVRQRRNSTQAPTGSDIDDYLNSQRSLGIYSVTGL